MVTNRFGVDYVPPQNGAELAVATYRLVGPPGATALLTLCETGDPVVNLALSLSDGSLAVPTVSNGQIDTIGPPNLLRGDCDGNLMFSGIADPLFALNYVFTPGSDVPPCLAQCDADGDAGPLDLADALHMLNFAFIPGSPPIPPPYPDCDLESAGSNSVAALGCDNPVCP